MRMSNICSFSGYPGPMLPPPAGPDPDGMRRYRQLCDEVSVVMGAVNVGAGRLVELVRLAVAEGQTVGTGIRSDAHWVAWRTGLSLRHAKDIVHLAKRSEQLPCCLAALTAGELTLDQAAMIAWHVPAPYEEACTRFAKTATVSQLRKALPRYGFEQPDSDGDPVVRERRECSTGTDELGYWFGGRLPEDEGAVVDAALRAKQDDLFRQRKAALPDGAKVPPVSRADALVALAEDSMAAGQAAKPGSDRYLVHVHLEAGPDGTIQLTTHLGLPLPDHQRRLILCDSALRGLVHDGLTPLGAGRKTRTINRRLRRAIEHRDGGCRVPGCDATVGLEIHHIWHWETAAPPSRGTSSASAGATTACTTSVSSPSKATPTSSPAPRERSSSATSTSAASTPAAPPSPASLTPPDERGPPPPATAPPRPPEPRGSPPPATSHPPANPCASATSTSTAPTRCRPRRVPPTSCRPTTRHHPQTPTGHPGPTEGRPTPNPPAGPTPTAHPPPTLPDPAPTEPPRSNAHQPHDRPGRKPPAGASARPASPRRRIDPRPDDDQSADGGDRSAADRRG